MARLSDIPRVVRRIGVIELFRRVLREVAEDSLATWAAALAYAWLFAIFPFVIFLMTLVPYLPASARDGVSRGLNSALHSSLPDQAADTIWRNVDKVFEKQHAGVLGLGLIITIWAASGGMNMTMSSLDRCYDIPRRRPFWKMRLWAIALTLVVAVLILGVLLLLPVGTLFTRWVQTHRPGTLSQGALWGWNVARYTLAIMLMFLILALIYYFGTSVTQDFHPVSPGAIFSIAVWVLLGLAFRLYVNKFGRYDRTYGTVAGVAILLFVFYIDALVLLIGAEINTEIDFACGVPRGSMDFRASSLVHQKNVEEL